jgi:signal transduction histidine kinase
LPTRPERPRRDVNRFSSLRTRLILLVLLALLPGLALLLSTGRMIDRRSAVLTLAALVIIAIGGAAADLFVVRRVRSLVKATRRVAGGDLGARIGPPYGRGELGQLARALDEMARALQERQGEAERARADAQASLVVLQASDEERKRLVAHLTQAQEQERGRIASDIHDDSIQAMTAVSIRLESLRRRLTDPGQLRVLEELEETVVLSIARLRHLLFELRPPVLDREGLAPALRVYLDELSKETGLVYEIVNALTAEPPEDTRRILYRITQEALTNVRKHARARRVTVTLEEEERGFRVRVRDDGQGFSVRDRQEQAPGHLGFTAMRERAELAGGWWRVASAPRAGTTVEFWLPARWARRLRQQEGANR